MTIPGDVRALLDGANFAHIATRMPDGAPHSVAIWVGTEGDRVAFFTQRGSRKGRNLAADPRVAISLVDHHNPYETAWLRGRVVETRDEEGLPVVDAISLKYTGRPFPIRTVTLYLVEVETSGSMSLPFEPPPA
jgi:PPOX class probable F420-dependent enzyme